MMRTTSVIASGRRTFLHQVLAGGVGLAGSSPAARTLPSVRLGDQRVSRLIMGNNPQGGFSHTTRRLDQLMTSYFTFERCVDLVLHAGQQGIDTWQTVPGAKFRKVLRAARERGSRMQLILLSTDTKFLATDDPALPKPIAIVHQGVSVDQMMRTRQPEKIHDYVKRIHDAGYLAGISTHCPDHLAKIEDFGWENDFYMTCFYDVYRPPEELKARLRDEPIGETYLASDPVKMTARIRQIRKPCLAFKILAAGRLGVSSQSVERAFQFAYGNIKPADAVIVGFYPVLHDEVAEDCEFARRFAAGPAPTA